MAVGTSHRRMSVWSAFLGVLVGISALIYTTDPRQAPLSKFNDGIEDILVGSKKLQTDVTALVSASWTHLGRTDLHAFLIKAEFISDGVDQISQAKKGHVKLIKDLSTGPDLASQMRFRELQVSVSVDDPQVRVEKAVLVNQDFWR
ncbi:hypothetical protein [Rhizobium sp. RU36D]|uniref:hypothetical protein n=1 Tax=Rhizobium sp. RU36D TaxID=1907415 RepID=UPI00117A0854|nr:hypothetical protein [Rhizobium sp. RU36D]